VRAIQENGDSLPLLRLIAEITPISFPAPRLEPDMAVTFVSCVNCQDYPQIYDMTSPPEARIAQRAASFALQRKTDPIFIIRSRWRNTTRCNWITACWIMHHLPVRRLRIRRSAGPPDATFTAAPVLVVHGDMDTLTPFSKVSRCRRNMDTPSR